MWKQQYPWIKFRVRDIDKASEGDMAGLVSTLPWLVNMLLVIPGATGVFERFTGWCYEQLCLKRESLAKERASNKNDEPRDAITWLINAMDEGDKSAPPTEHVMQEDARTLIIMGRYRLSHLTFAHPN
jgi:hypothetical protein